MRSDLVTRGVYLKGSATKGASERQPQMLRRCAPQHENARGRTGGLGMRAHHYLWVPRSQNRDLGHPAPGLVLRPWAGNLNIPRSPDGATLEVHRIRRPNRVRADNPSQVEASSLPGWQKKTIG